MNADWEGTTAKEEAGPYKDDKQKDRQQQMQPQVLRLVLRTSLRMTFIVEAGLRKRDAIDDVDTFD
jgi:hypothetical protein